MGQPFVGEIRMFAGNFAPAGWAFCNGAVMAISENDTLFQLIGTTYGGDGQETFALPNLQSRVPIHQGNNFILGETGGAESVTLTTQQIPNHSHLPLCSGDANNNTGSANAPGNNVWATQSSTGVYTTPTDPNNNGAPVPRVSMNPNAIGISGGSQPHDNMIPFLVINFIISLFGLYPSPT